MTPVHILGKNNPDCPLCSKPFELIQQSGHGLTRDFYVCKKDKVAILVKDPLVGHWNDHKDLDSNMEIPCTNPKCREKMNLFCRSDGYMKAVCPNPRCGASVSTEEIEDANYYSRPGKEDDNDPLKE